MRELLDGIFAGPRDPTEAAQRAVRPALRRRFYEHARVEHAELGPGEEEFRVTLDGRVVKTPSGRALATPRRALAEALVAEWEGQRSSIDPLKMPVTRLANSIIDGVVPLPSAVAAEVEKYLASDLVYYRAEGPQALVERQAAAWDPILDWASASLGARFVVSSGMRHINQCPEALRAASAAIPDDPWRLGAVHSMTTLTGSALIALAVANEALSPTAAWSAAHVDEDWNMDLWGRDDLSVKQRAFRWAEFTAAAQVLRTLER